MADKKITALSAIASVAGTDLIPVVDDVAGTPTTTKATVTQLRTAIVTGIVNTEIDASAAIASSKIAPPGANLGVVFNDAGALNATAGLEFNKATNNLRATILSAGASGLPGTGSIRTINGTAGALVARNSANSADVQIIYCDTSSRATMGDAATNNYVRCTSAGGDAASRCTGEWIYGVGAGQSHLLQVNGSTVMSVGPTIKSAVPMLGDAVPNGAVDGRVTLPTGAGGTYTALAAEYSMGEIKIPSGALFSTVAMPHPATENASYRKPFENASAGAITISTGTGTTYSLAAGASKILSFTPSGVRLANS